MSILGWWLYPETKGVRFEKLDELYAKGVAPRHFKKEVSSEYAENGLFPKKTAITEAAMVE